MIQQPIHTSNFSLELPTGTSGATQNHAQVGPSSCVVIIAETAIRIRRWCWRGILGWHHSPKMADLEMCVPVSIGFGETALIPACFECCALQMCVRQRKCITTTCGMSFDGNWFPSEESATDPGPWVDHRTGDCPLESDGSGENAVLCQTVETLLTGLRKNPGGGGGRQRMFVHWNRNIRDIMRSHISRWIVETVKEAYTQAEGEFDRVMAHEVSPVSVMGRTTVR